MNVSRMGTFYLDSEVVTGFFVSATIDELRNIPFNPLLASVELHPLNTEIENAKLPIMKTIPVSYNKHLSTGNLEIY